MYYCNCGAPVRAIYLPDENQYEPDDVCQSCYEASYYSELEEEMEQAFILAERDRLKDIMIQIDLEELPF